ncbi:MAG: hypothetical protein HZB50_09445 [Chloroflexi bacterium]|nr:hypothetical protein [Chloroflexota bacterium]
MNKIRNIFRIWLPFAVVIAAFCALTYASVQQAYRQNANDPQIQMAEDAADALNSGTSVEAIVPAVKVSVAKALSPFFIVYDSSGKVLSANVQLDGQVPGLPDGVLDATKEMGENRVTWQPRPGVRIAAVIVSYKEGFVLAGRNLREVETREAQVTQFAGMTLILAWVATFIVIAFGEFFLADKK